MLGADHLTLEGGGGWVILKKNFLQALVGRKKLHAAQRKEKKNSCTATSKEKMLQSYFIIPGGALQNPSKTATIPDNLQASKPLWLAY